MSWGEGMQSKQKPQWAIFKKSHQMNQQQSGKSIGNGCSLSKMGQASSSNQQHLCYKQNKHPQTNIQTYSFAYGKTLSAADSLMLMLAGWWWWLSDKYSNSTH